MHRLTFARVLIVIGTLLAIVAILSVWISRQVLDSGQWTKTSSQLLEQPAVQTALATTLVDRLYANVDVAGELRQALPPRADVLAGPAAGALRRGAEDVARRALADPRVQQAWEQANKAAHAKLIDLVVNGKGKALTNEGGVVTLDLTALLGAVAQRTGLGEKVVAKLPPSASSIEILRSDQLGTVQSIARALKPLAAVFVLLTLACYAAAIALARGRRREMVRAAGLSFIFAGAVALVVRALVGNVVVDELASTAAMQPAIEDVWSVSTSFLVGVATATIAYGALAVAGAWLAGPTRYAVRARTFVAPYLRDPRIAYGAVAAVVLLMLLWGPTESTRRPLPALILVVLLLAGVEALRRQVIREVPEALPEPAAEETDATFTPPEPPVVTHT